jgi:hypothetical protein
VKIDLKTGEIHLVFKKKHIVTNKMNSCVMFSAALAAIILLRIMFSVMEFDNINGNRMDNDFNDDFDDTFIHMTKKQLRSMHESLLTYKGFEKIHKQVLLIAATGGHEHQFNLCHRAHDIEAMIKEACPDSVIISMPKNNTCAAYKMTW